MKYCWECGDGEERKNLEVFYYAGKNYWLCAECFSNSEIVYRHSKDIENTQKGLFLFDRGL